MDITEIMTSSPVRLTLNETVRDALSKMAEHEIRHLPVVDRDQLVGMVSDRDLKYFEALEGSESATLNMHFSRLEEKVSKFMQTAIVSVDSKGEVSDVIRLMIENRIGAVPVVDSDRNKLLGIVSYVDVLKAVEDLV